MQDQLNQPGGLPEGGDGGKPAQPRIRLPARTIVAPAIIGLVVPALIILGMAVLGDRKYYFISLLIILCALLPFVMIFEQRRPQAREIVIIAVLAAIAVVGRSAAFMLPEFKPVIAIIIITGVCLGAEAGFLVGVITAFVSNFFFGQGPWTPWQMFSLGIIGYLAGVLFAGRRLPVKKTTLCVFGALCAFFIYGVIMDTANVLIYQGHLNRGLLWASYAAGLGFNAVHALSTVIFLGLLSGPMIEKLERIKIKYGLVEAKL